MKCPKCNENNTIVIDSREIEDNTTIRRRRECTKCQYRFSTYENNENITPNKMIDEYKKKIEYYENIINEIPSEFMAYFGKQKEEKEVLQRKIDRLEKQVQEERKALSSEEKKILRQWVIDEEMKKWGNKR